jgi:hypothetical protein
LIKKLNKIFNQISRREEKRREERKKKKQKKQESPYGQVMLQNLHFTASNPHVTCHQINKSAKNKKKLTHTMRNTQRKENPTNTPMKETPGQTKPTAGRGSGPTSAVGLARPAPTVGLVPRRQWVW